MVRGRWRNSGKFYGRKKILVIKNYEIIFNHELIS